MFKSYASKKNALRAAAKAGVPAEQVYELEGKWGYEEAAEPAEALAPVDLGEGEPSGVDWEPEEPLTEPVAPMPELAPQGWTHAETGTEPPMQEVCQPEAAAPATVVTPAGPTAEQIAAAKAVLAAAKVPKATRTPRANAVVQHGVQRPGPGKCLDVWRECERLAAASTVPTPELVKAWAGATGANSANAVIELYRWRKFNGITGRVTAPAVAPAAAPAANEPPAPEQPEPQPEQEPQQD